MPETHGRRSIFCENGTSVVMGAFVIFISTAMGYSLRWCESKVTAWWAPIHKQVAAKASSSA